MNKEYFVLDYDRAVLDRNVDANDLMEVWGDALNPIYECMKREELWLVDSSGYLDTDLFYFPKKGDIKIL